MKRKITTAEERKEKSVTFLIKEPGYRFILAGEEVNQENFTRTLPLEMQFHPGF